MTTLRNIPLSPDPWNAATSPLGLFWKMAGDYRNHREAVLKAGARKSPALPLALLTTAQQCRLRIDQIAHAAGVSKATVSAAFARNELLAEENREGPRGAAAARADLLVSLKGVSPGTPITKHAPLLKSVPARERAQLRTEFWEISERLRHLGLSFADIAALCGRSVQTVHQWRIRTSGNYPAPAREIIDDLKRAADQHQAVLARARTVLETFA